MARKKREIRPKLPEERISDVAQHWFLVEPLLFSTYCTHALIENGNLHIPLRTGEGKIEFNPALIEGMSDQELADRLKVEALRILLKHPYLRQPFRARPEILYLASNMTILDNMEANDAFCFELVPQGIVEKLPQGKTFEEYYGLLNHLIPPPPPQAPDNSTQLREEASSTGKEASDLPIQLWAEAASTWEEDSIMVVDINILIRTIMAGPAKGWGTIPGKFVECIKASLLPPVDIANLLKGFKKSILSQRRNLTRMRPSRRYGFEQMGSRYAYTTKVLVALDVSGSVSSDMLSRMLGLINRIFKQGVENIDVLQFDSELKGAPQPIRKAINTFKVLGRGGTDFQPAADFYMAHPEYDGLIYITDGEAPDPVIPPEHRHLPVTWFITDDDLIPTLRHSWPT